MTFRVRPASGEDFRAIYQMAKLTGGGFTNLPADRGTLVAKLARSDDSFARKDDCQAADLYVFVLEDPKRESGAKHSTVDSNHGRIETRTSLVSTEIGSKTGCTGFSIPS